MWKLGFIDFHISAACLGRRSSSGGGLGLLLDPASLVLGRAGVVQSGVHAAAVVPAQPVEHRVLGFADGCEALSVEPLDL